MDFAALGYEVAHHGSGTWNGVAIASRIGISQFSGGMPESEDWTDEGGRFLVARAAAPSGWRAIYVPNGRVVGSEFYDAKLEWLDHLDGWLRAVNDPSTALAPVRRLQRGAHRQRRLGPGRGARRRPTSRRQSGSGWREAAWSGGWSTSCASSTPNRATSRGGTTARATSTRTSGCGSTTSWRRAPLAARAVSAERDRDARKPSTYPGIPSDHAPVVVDFS